MIRIIHGGRSRVPLTVWFQTGSRLSPRFFLAASATSTSRIQNSLSGPTAEYCGLSLIWHSVFSPLHSFLPKLDFGLIVMDGGRWHFGQPVSIHSHSEKVRF